MPVDYARDHDVETWSARVRRVDFVVNAVGAFEGGALEAVHTRAPVALFDACAKAGVRVVQISALGADEHARSAFHRTKRAADDHLRATHCNATILQPSLVYGRGGASARMFDALATLPCVPLPGGGGQRIQPVHIEDVADAVVATIERPGTTTRTIPVVGPSALTLREYLQALRTALGAGRGCFVAVPRALTSAALRFAAALGVPWASRDALAMLERGNVADPAPLAELLGRPPRAVDAFVARDEREAVRREAHLAWLLPLARLSLAAVWLITAAVTLFAWPIEDSVAMVERTGLTGALALAAVYAGALLDTAFGIATLTVRRARWLWIAQAAVILVYSAIIAVALPEFLAHPFGPVVKNLPILALLALLYGMERR